MTGRTRWAAGAATASTAGLAAAGTAALLALAARPLAGQAAESAAAATAAPAAAADTLTLEAALDAALARNPDVQAARARRSSAAAGRLADWGAFLPDATASARFQRTDGTRLTFEGEDGTPRATPEPISFTSKSATQQLRLDWTLLDSGRGLLDLKEGAARVEAATHRISSRQREVAARVKRAYFEALKQQRLLRVARRQLEARRQDLEVTRERVEAGVGTRTDLLGARVEVGNAELAVLDAEDLLRQELRTLRSEMGTAGAAGDGAESLRDVETLPDAGRLDREALVAGALASDPEVRALEADASAASTAATRGWTRYLPEVTASYTRTLSEDGGADASFLNLSPSDHFDGLGLTVSWNLLDGFGRQEEIARADAELGETRAEKRRRVIELEREIGNLMSEIRRRDERLEVLERNAELASERLELARISYEEGLRTFDQLQDFIDEERRAEEQLARERYEYLKRWADLEEAAGPLGGRARTGS